jgi:ribosomal protein S9
MYVHFLLLCSPGQYSTLAQPPQDNEYPRVPKAKYPKISPYGTVTGSGKRKTAKAVAAIFSPGTGQITINGKHWMDYFPQYAHIFPFGPKSPSIFVRSTMLEPIIASEKFNNVDIKCKVTGGGFMGQAGAIKNALANALVNGLYPVCFYQSR